MLFRSRADVDAVAGDSRVIARTRRATRARRGAAKVGCIARAVRRHLAPRAATARRALAGARDDARDVPADRLRARADARGDRVRRRRRRGFARVPTTSRVERRARVVHARGGARGRGRRKAQASDK